MWSPHPFHWVPAGGLRHASTDPHPNGGVAYPDNTEVGVLCGGAHRAHGSDESWLWPECETCRARACELAGTAPPPVLA